MNRTALSLSIVRPSDWRRMPWKNGGGLTNEIARGGPSNSADSWHWRISLAEVSQDGPFSAFTGIDRHIVVVEGAGMELDFGERRALLRPGEVLAFDGAATPYGLLLQGPVKDFNVMVRRGQARAQLSVVAAKDCPHALTIDGVACLHLLAGRLSAGTAGRSLQLASQDSLLAEGSGALNLEPSHDARLAIALIALTACG